MDTYWNRDEKKNPYLAYEIKRLNNNEGYLFFQNKITQVLKLER